MARLWTVGVGLIAFVLTVAAATVAEAGSLPPMAVPLRTEDVVKLHAGKTGTYPTIDEYFSPDGMTMGVFGKPTVKSTFSGKWVAFGNTLCTLNGRPNEPRVYVDCSAFWRDGDRLFLLWSTHSDGSKPDVANGYYEATNTLKPGNLIADKYKAAGGQ